MLVDSSVVCKLLKTMFSRTYRPDENDSTTAIVMAYIRFISAAVLLDATVAKFSDNLLW